ncbi:MAG: CPBP family intramembrane metalloprotease, partial [Allobaculum sp.]|nr:CPBP family intramembrane metalloprotease [Allobaculum sp.]
SSDLSTSKKQTEKVDKKDKTTKEEKKKAKEKKKEVDPTKPPKPSLSQKISSWSKEAKETKDAFLEASAPQSDSYSFESALQNHKPSLPTQKESANLSTPLSPQAFMMKNPGKPLGFSQVLQVCMASVWIYLGVSFMLGMMLGVSLNLTTNYEMYLMGYSIIFWSTTTITGSMAIAYGSSILKVNPFKALQNTHFERHWIWKGFSMMVAANLILSIITTFFMDLFSTFVFPLAPSPDFDVTGMPLLAGALEFVIVCLIGPVFEEMLYRGLIYRNLSRFNQGFAIVFSALLFGLAHGNLGQAVPTFGVGLVLAYVYAKTNSIWVPIILHILNNTCLMLISTFPIVDIVISIILW